MSTNHQAVDGNLSLWDLDDLEGAEITAERASVKALHLGARLYSALPLASLISRLTIFNKTELIRLADDRTPDEDMKAVEQMFHLAFENARFEWTWDGLVAGKHGR